ncbi:putative RING-H2 finger protein ATL19 [Ziziphus jujuba]|uniref:RING-H2 finger protein ATL19 n=2 Tax=Ziziphus jujuba TaxID=326968 RepID=A0ABM3ZX27_ZIZJJ|nr:putative RING-H2 finger protein ATL19 [Ziziphus jujuba]
MHGRQKISKSRMESMVPRIFVLSFSPFSSFISASGTLIIVFICIIVFSVILSLVIVAAIYIFCEFFFWHMLERWQGQGDVEVGRRVRRRHGDVHQRPLQGDEIYPVSVQNNLRILVILDRIIRSIEGGDDVREHVRLQQALERMPPPMCFGNHELRSRFSSECCICLEEYETGDRCQVFPVCNHVYHSNCIDNWLKKNSTCPICRNCILHENE